MADPPAAAMISDILQDSASRIVDCFSGPGGALRRVRIVQRGAGGVLLFGDVGGHWRIASGLSLSATGTRLRGTGVTGVQIDVDAGTATGSLTLPSNPGAAPNPFALGSTQSIEGYLGSVAPARLLDTRSGVGAGGPVAGRRAIAVGVLGRGGVPPAGVSAVVLNVTVTEPRASGFVTVYGSGLPRPTTSNLNFNAGVTVPNLVVAPVGPDGKVAFFNGSQDSVQLIADVAGYYLA